MTLHWAVLGPAGSRSIEKVQLRGKASPCEAVRSSSLAAASDNMLPARIRVRCDRARMRFTIHKNRVPEERMRKIVSIVAFVFLVPVVLLKGIEQARAQSNPYPAMAPLQKYLMPKDAEIALARSAAPASIADTATVLVLGPQGYTTAVQGTDGFVCYVERSWAHDTDHPEFWNPKARTPNCFNAAAASSVVPLYLMKTRLVLEGKSQAEIAQAIAAALDSGKLPALAPGGMCYMMSKEQYINDQGHSWHPHVMFYAAGDVAKSWGANLPGSPLLAAYDAQARLTTFLVVVSHWSDGTPGPEGF